MARLAPEFCLAEEGDLVDPATVFGRVAPIVVEIGIGIGDELTSMALVDPEVDVIGCDVHTPGIAAALAGIDELGLANVRVVHGDALVFLDRIAPASLAGIRIYFPDPWPKVRHHHRRLVSEPHVGRLVERLAPGGFVHIATDVDDYARQAERVCADNGSLVGGAIARPAWRPVTRFESRAIEAGHSITDLLYRKQA